MTYTPAKGAPTGATDPFASTSAPGGIDSGVFGSGSGQIVTGSTGDTPGGAFLQGLNSKGQPASSAVSSSGDELLKQLFQMPKNDVKALQQKLIAAGSTQVQVTGIADSATVNAYSQLLNYASLYQSANPNSPNAFTPDELLDSLAASNPGKSKTVNEKSTSISLTDPVKAQQTLVAAMADKLGRKPTDQEIAQFTGALNAYETANPTVTDTTRQTDASGLETSSNQTTSGKATDPTAYAQQYIQSNHAPEAQAVQHLQFWNIAMNALQGSGVNTGNSD